MCSRSSLSEHVTAARSCLYFTVLKTDESSAYRKKWFCVVDDISSLTMSGLRLDPWGSPASRDLETAYSIYGNFQNYVLHVIIWHGQTVHVDSIRRFFKKLYWSLTGIYYLSYILQKHTSLCRRVLHMSRMILLQASLDVETSLSSPLICSTSQSAQLQTAKQWDGDEQRTSILFPVL